MQSLESVVATVKKSISQNLSATAFDLWIEHILPITMLDSTVFLFVKTNFQKEIISTKYLKVLTEEFNDTFGFSVSIKIVTQQEFETDNIPNQIKDKRDLIKRCMQSSKTGVKKAIMESLDLEHTFDNFIVGSSNNFAYSTCKAIVKDDGDLSYNPLFIYASSGLGKTHLLLAIKNEMLKKNPTLNIQYVNGETFGNELIEAIKEKTTAKFHQKYRNIDFLLMDDIQFIAGKIQTQEEFFHTFNRLHQVGKQIVLTSDRPPKDIKTLEQRLRTRFEWGLLADISMPDFETRMAIIGRKAQQLGVEIPSNLSEYVAHSLKDNIRQLEGVVKKIKAHFIINSEYPSLNKTKIFIQEVLNDNKPPSVTMDNIISEVSRTYGISEGEIKSNKRTASITIARQASIYIIREVTGATYEEIGKVFSNRDHSTITYSLKKMSDIIKKDVKQRDLVNDLINNIKSN